MIGSSDQGQKDSTDDLSNLRARENPPISTRTRSAAARARNKGKTEIDEDDVSYESAPSMDSNDWDDNNNNNNNNNGSNDLTGKPAAVGALRDELHMRDARIQSLQDELDRLKNEKEKEKRNNKNKSKSKKKDNTLNTDEADLAMMNMTRMMDEEMRGNQGGNGNNGNNDNGNSNLSFNLRHNHHNNNNNSNGSGNNSAGIDTNMGGNVPSAGTHIYNNNNGTGISGAAPGGYGNVRGSEQYGFQQFMPYPTHPIMDNNNSNHIIQQGMLTDELKEQATAKAAPKAFEEAMKGNTDVELRLFLIQILRLCDLLKCVPKNDIPKITEREVPFGKVDLFLATINCVIEYLVNLVISIENNNIDNTLPDHLKNKSKILKNVNDLCKITSFYFSDKMIHTQKSWIRLLFKLLTNDLKSNTLLTSFKNSKDELQQPGQEVKLLEGGNQSHVSIDNPYLNRNNFHYGRKNNGRTYNRYQNNNNNNNNSNNGMGNASYPFENNDPMYNVKIQDIMQFKHCNKMQAIALYHRYKKMECKQYHRTGLCKRSPKCWFSHLCKICIEAHPDCNCPLNKNK